MRFHKGSNFYLIVTRVGIDTLCRHAAILPCIFLEWAHDLLQDCKVVLHLCGFTFTLLLMCSNERIFKDNF